MSAGLDLILSRDRPHSVDDCNKAPGAKTREEELECNINSGVFVVRSSPKGRCFLKRWEEMAETMANDQIGLRQLWYENACQIRTSTHVMGYGDFQTFAAVHLMNQPSLWSF